MVVVSGLSSLLGIPEPAARFLFGLFLTYPVAVIYRPLIHHVSSRLQGIICAASGFCLLSYVFGPEQIWHSLSDILTVYAVLVLFGGGIISLSLTWIITMTHLLVGYMLVMQSNQVHPITWTIPHCVLVLKLIGLAYDLYDGSKPQSLLTEEQKEKCLLQVPSFAEYLGFSYFFGNVLVGPQLNFVRYQQFITRKLFDVETTPSSLLPGLRRLSLALFLAIGYSFCNRYFPLAYLLTDEYQARSFVSKLAIMVVTGRLAFWRYMCVWVLAEATCIMTGISYGGEHKNGSGGSSVEWTSICNVHFVQNETSVTLQGTIDSFNVQTNRWAAMYVFKRLKWLGNKTLSHLMTLLFLSLWHGVWPGYLICLSFEFLAITCERQFIAFMKKRISLAKVSVPMYILLWIGAYTLKNVMLMYPLMSFMLLSWDACWKFMSSVYWIGHVTVLMWFLFYQSHN